MALFAGLHLLLQDCDKKPVESYHLHGYYAMRFGACILILVGYLVVKFVG